MHAEIISGKNAVLELLRAKKRRCFEIWISLGRKEKISSEIERLGKENKAIVRHVSNEELLSISGSEKNQGVAARVERFIFADLSKILEEVKKKPKRGFLLVLDGILDPHNLGSIIRSAHLLGVDGVILPKDNSAPISATVVKTSAGATEYLPIVEVTNIVSTLNSLKEKGFWVVGAEGENGSNLYLFDFTGENYVLVLGGEGKGIRRLVKEHCDHLLSIPMFGKVGSYNVSIAGAIFMAEVLRQRQFKNL